MPAVATTNSKRAPRMPPAQRYAQLLAVAEETFVARGYAEVSMEDIARAAGVTRPVVYDHFGSKDGAFLAIVKRAREEFDAGLWERVATTTSVRERLQAGGDHLFTVFEANPARWQLLFCANGSGVFGEELRAELARLRFETIEEIRGMIAEGAPNAPADRLEACAHAISGAGERLGLWWITRPDISKADMVDHFMEITWAGLAPYVD